MVTARAASRAIRQRPRTGSDEPVVSGRLKRFFRDVGESRWGPATAQHRLLLSIEMAAAPDFGEFGY